MIIGELLYDPNYQFEIIYLQLFTKSIIQEAHDEVDEVDEVVDDEIGDLLDEVVEAEVVDDEDEVVDDEVGSFFYLNSIKQK